MASLSYRQLTEMAELAQCTVIEHRIWGEEIVPGHLLKAMATMGGLAVGAFADGELVGCAYGFLGHSRTVSEPGELLHHSHVLAVLPEWRGHGIGEGLKRKQAELCREQGLGLMTWTFDPLRARNAHLNLEKLGARVRRYEASYYGDMSDAQNGQLDSDRLLAEWRFAGDTDRWTGDPAALPRALTALPTGLPAEPDLELSAPAVHVAVPADVGRLLDTAPHEAVLWRESVRIAMRHYLMQGFVATRFLAGGYVLSRA